jgi:hypothetical protein
MKQILLLLVLFAGKADAQNKFRFHSFISVGILEGEKATSSVIESVNGMSYKNWFVGAGVSIDHYTFRTTPVYLQLRKEFGKPVFIFLSGGQNFPWVKNTEEQTWMKTKFYPKLYYEGGIGYRWPVGKNNSLVLSAGYSQKKLEEIKTYRNGICIGWNCQPETVQKFEHRLRTLVLKAGIRF